MTNCTRRLPAISLIRCQAYNILLGCLLATVQVVSLSKIFPDGFARIHRCFQLVNTEQVHFLLSSFLTQSTALSRTCDSSSSPRGASSSWGPFYLSSIRIVQLPVQARPLSHQQ
jgi:hypothetical protein